MGRIITKIIEEVHYVGSDGTSITVTEMGPHYLLNAYNKARDNNSFPTNQDSPLGNRHAMMSVARNSWGVEFINTN